MKRHILLSLLLLLTVSAGAFVINRASAQEERPDAVLLTEDFAYPTGQLTTVSSGNWVNFSGTGNFLQVTSPGLTYSNYAGSGVGNKVEITSVSMSAEDAYRGFAAQTSGTVYAAFLVNVANTTGLLDNGSTTGDYFAGFLPSANTTALVGRVSIRQGTAANTFQLGLRATSSNAATSFSTTDLAVGATHLVVISYQIVTGDANDVVSMWVNPALGGAQPAAMVSQTTATATDNADISRFFIRQGTTTTPNASIDGIRVGTAWADVAATSGGATPTPTATATPSASPTPSGSPTPAPGTLPKRLFTSRLSGAQEVPANNSTGRGYGRVVLNPAETQITVSVYFENLTANTISGHIHGPAAPGANAPVLFDLAPPTGVTRGQVVDRTFNVTAAQVADLRAGLWYFNIHSTAFQGGEIRGQIGTTNDAPVDLNGDGRTDYSVVRQATGAGGTQARWFNLTNSTPQVESQVDFGVITDSITPGDFDGDGKDDIAVWRSAPNASTFFILQSTTNTLRTVRFGIPNDDPFVIQDYDGDGVDDPAIFRRPANAGEQAYFWWYGSYGITKNVEVPVRWGAGLNDVAVPGDFNGDGKADFVVYRSTETTPARGVFLIRYGTGGFDAPSNNDAAVRFGLPDDAVVPGDYNGDGTTDFALTRFEGANIAWYVLLTTNVNTLTFSRQAWGRNGADTEVQGDYDGDGRTDYAVWRSTQAEPQGTYYILRSSDNTAQYQRWGFAGDIPAAVDIHN